MQNLFTLLILVLLSTSHGHGAEQTEILNQWTIINPSQQEKSDLNTPYIPLITMTNTSSKPLVKEIILKREGPRSKKIYTLEPEHLTLYIYLHTEKASSLLKILQTYFMMNRDFIQNKSFALELSEGPHQYYCSLSMNFPIINYTMIQTIFTEIATQCDFSEKEGKILKKIYKTLKNIMKKDLCH